MKPSARKTIRAGDFDQGGLDSGEVRYIFDEDMWNRRFPDMISVRLVR